jgi:MtN3 and saliva related transmembrane protein
MSSFWIVTIGIVAGILTTGAWLPQVIKTWRTRSAHDFSWGYLALFATGVVLWAVYGVLRGDAAVTGANVVTIALVIGVIAVKMRERR